MARFLRNPLLVLLATGAASIATAALGGPSVIFPVLFVLYLLGWIAWKVANPTPGASQRPQYGLGIREQERIRAAEAKRAADNRAFHKRAEQRNKRP